MGNTIEYECDAECHYWEIMHKVGDFEYRQQQFAKCSHCTKPMRLEAYKKHWDKRSKEV